MPDRDGVMKRQGLNTKVPDMSRLMENAQVMARERAVWPVGPRLWAMRGRGCGLCAKRVPLGCERSWWMLWTVILKCQKRSQH